MNMGEWYEVTHVMQKSRDVDSDGDTVVKWTEQGVEPTQMMYLGKRTVFDGVHRWVIDLEDGDYEAFFQSTSHSVYLFVKDERTNPVYVLRSRVDVE